jgi:hypothetical protein
MWRRTYTQGAVRLESPSTVSIARTTPAQKPRGFARITRLVAVIDSRSEGVTCV